MMRFRAIVVEDEEPSRNRLVRLLADWNDDIEIVGEAAHGEEALEKIRSLAPDLLFLDLQLPGLGGFEVLERLERQPLVIFTTADEKQALNAFKTNAVDYLLKPIGQDDLSRAIAKLKHMTPRPANDVRAALSDILRTLSEAYLERVACKVGEKIFLVKTGEILFFQADNKYTMVQTSGKGYLIDTPLIELEKQLNPKDFIRIHRSILVNLAWIAEIRRQLDGKLKVVLLDKSGTELIASRSYSDNLKNIR